MLYKKMFYVELSENERTKMTPAPNHWERADGRYSRRSRTGAGETPADGSL